jgi:PAS domain S-box-containing protein
MPHPLEHLLTFRSSLSRYAFAVFSFLIASGFALLADRYNFHNVEVPLYLFAIALTAWYAGSGPASLGVVLAILAFDYFFTEPRYTFYVTVSDLPYFIVFIGFALLVAWFSAVRHRAERDLLRARDDLQIEVAERSQQASLLDLTHDSIFVRDMDFFISYWNRGAEELYGWKSADAIGKNSQELLQTVYPAPLEEIRAVLLRTGRWEGELQRTTASGSQVIVAARWSLQRDEQQNPRAILETSNDITERKRREQEIQNLNQELTKRSGQLESANKELEAFAYTISHDLRAPLRHMAGYSELLQRHASKVLDEKGHRFILMILDSAKRMGNLIDDLLTFSRVGRAETQQSVVNMPQLVSEALGDFRQETHGRDISWKIGELPDLYGDRAMLRLVLVNLLSNAIKFTRTRPHAEIEIGCSAPGDGEVTVFVKDNGVGFDMKYANKLFGVFQRLHQADAFEGTGIGLATVQRIIHRHGGKVWAESAVNQGATFYFSAPKPRGQQWKQATISAAS